MLGRILTGILTVLLALGILAASIFRSATVDSYAFSLPPTPAPDSTPVLGDEDVFIDYYLAHPGGILPDSPLWFIKVIRDRLWLLVTANTEKKAELNLLFADKRLVASKFLFENGKPELAFTTLVKAEGYLSEAHNLERKANAQGNDTSQLLTKISKAALKHQEVVAGEILSLAPSDAKPEIVKTKGISEGVFENTKHSLQERGLPVPPSPFEGEN